MLERTGPLLSQHREFKKLRLRTIVGSNADRRYLIKHYIELRECKKLLKEIKSKYRSSIRHTFISITDRLKGRILTLKSEINDCSLTRTTKKYTLKRKGIKVSYSYTRINDATFKSSHSILRQLRLRLTENRLDRKTQRMTTKRYYSQNIVVCADGVHTEEGTFLKLKEHRLFSELSEDKRPLSEERHVGVEIEFFCETSENQLKRQLIDAGLSPYIQLKDDGSLDNSSACCGDCDDCMDDEECHYYEGERVEGSGYEIALCCPLSISVEIIKDVCTLLRDNDAAINKTCGLHVHIDARYMSNVAVKRAYKNLFNSQHILLAMQPSSRRNNSYCQPLEDSDSYPDGRYYAINPLALDKFNTFEVRCHSATLNASKINNWIDLLFTIADHVCIQSHTSLGAFLSYINDGSAKDYVLKRLKLFCPRLLDDIDITERPPYEVNISPVESEVIIAPLAGVYEISSIPSIDSSAVAAATVHDSVVYEINNAVEAACEFRNTVAWFEENSE